MSGRMGGLAAHLKIKVDGFVREGGKLITEAKLIHALDLGLVREAVILFLGFTVDGVPQGAQSSLHRSGLQ